MILNLYRIKHIPADLKTLNRIIFKCRERKTATTLVFRSRNFTNCLVFLETLVIGEENKPWLVCYLITKDGS